MATIVVFHCKCFQRNNQFACKYRLYIGNISNEKPVPALALLAANIGSTLTKCQHLNNQYFLPMKAILPKI